MSLRFSPVSSTITILVLITATTASFLLGTSLDVPQGWPLEREYDLRSAFIDTSRSSAEPGPLQQFSFPALRNYQGQASTIQITRLIENRENSKSFAFNYSSRGKSISGQLTLPVISNQDQAATSSGTIVMFRGYVPQEIYEIGMGTRNAAHYFAENNYITLAPDFLGYGESDTAADDPWEARFVKTINAIDLLASVTQAENFQIDPEVSKELSSAEETLLTSMDTERDIGIWAHSNGGQIALSSLIVTNKTYPTTLWAPVTAPFPYSILYFGDEQEDEGKAQRAWIAQFEREYDVLDFSLTQHLEELRAPLQIQQGARDEAIPYVWNDEFSEKIENENIRRAEATESATPEKLPYEYHLYPTADHNLRGAWQTAVEQDLEFFAKYFK